MNIGIDLQNVMLLLLFVYDIYITFFFIRYVKEYYEFKKIAAHVSSISELEEFYKNKSERKKNNHC